MKTKIFFCIIIVSLFCVGCIEKEKNKSEKSDISRLDIVIAIDGTGSYDYDKIQRETAIEAIQKAPAGSHISVRWITENSYTDKNLILAENLPALENDQAQNPFDVRAKKLAKSLQILRAQKLMEIADVIKTESYPESKQTDIYGLLMRVSAQWQNLDKTVYSPKLIITSDLRHNANTKLSSELNFKDAEIIIANFQEDQASDFEQMWRKKFTGWGAKNVIFSRMDKANKISSEMKTLRRNSK